MSESKTNQVNGQLGDKHKFIRCKFHHIPLVLMSLEPEQWRCERRITEGI